MNTKEAYSNFATSTNLANSGKASSYIRALDLLSEMIEAVPMGFSDCEDIWSPPPIERLNQLYHFVCEEKKKGTKSKWNLPNLPKSYLQNGYCSAALRDYQSFLVEHRHEQSLLEEFSKHNGTEDEAVRHLEREIEIPPFLLEDIADVEGKEVMRMVKARSNQRVFQKIVRSNYGQACCITGIEVPEVNRASHIIPWAKNKETRMDPRNGLYLSATYDAAFDRNLLSLDEDFRVILSNDLKDHYTSESTKIHFLSKEGQKIRLPKSFLPKQEFLETHRRNGNF
ncbi:HNH endonuclease [Roseibacillus persicicus]|uniref:HNH endonuclease n=1 Tax=Roseibacillus persicicus TaxID=454148 RepID=UPI00398B8D27